MGARPDWHLFNDFLVLPIPEAKVLTAASWKVPAVVMYERVDGASLVDYSTLPATITPTILLHDLHNVPYGAPHASTRKI